MIKHRLYQSLMVLVAIALIAGAGTLQRPIDTIRRDMDRASGEDVTESFVELRLGQAIPGFLKAVIINYLWIRGEVQKSKGQYYDAEYTSQQICRLQPRFPTVWQNRAWNLAYNISVKHYTGADRWACVQEGIRLLRDEGLKYNPKALPLYLELSWTYQHKLGEVIDDMHLTYKRYHAGEFHRVLGSPPRRGFADYMERYRQWLQPVVDAPSDRATLVADPDVATMVAQLEAAGVPLGMPVLDVYNAWSVDPLVRELRQPAPQPKDDDEALLQTLMASADLAAPRAKIVAYSRRKVLSGNYRMKPEWMLHIAEHYGPVDWRLPWAHSLYWASYGLYHVKGLDVNDLDPINTGRHITESLKQLSAFGQLTVWYNPDDPSLPYCDFGPDWRFVEAANQTFLELGQFYAEDQTPDDETFAVYKTGHENFLRRAIQVLYFAGRIDEADKYLDYLGEKYEWNPLYKLDLEQFVWHVLDEQGLTQLSTVQLLVTQLIDNAFLNVATGRDEDATFLLQRARFFWNEWNTLVGHDTRKELDNQFTRLVGAGAIRAMAMTTDPLVAMQIWEGLTPFGQRAAYDMLQEQFRDVCERQGIDFDKAFPEPTGMAEYRAAEAEHFRQNVTPGSETGGPWRAKFNESEANSGQ